MKLSEAIRLGAMLSPQGFGSYVSTDGARCALGAALEAIGGGKSSLFDTWDWMIFHKATCPECGCSQSTGFIIGQHLNDDHRWTRERIADWVATIEPRRSKDAPQESAVDNPVEVPELVSA